MDKFRHKGMTMVELIIVVLIIAILVGLAVPSMTVYFEKARLRGAADDIVALLAEARQGAVKENKQIAVSILNDGSNWCAGANPAGNPAAPGDPIPGANFCDCAAAGACGMRALSAAAYSGVSRPAGGADINFRFDPKLGTRTNMALLPQLLLQSSSARFQLQITINPIGQARVCRPAAKGIITGYPTC